MGGTPEFSDRIETLAPLVATVAHEIEWGPQYLPEKTPGFTHRRRDAPL